MTGAEPDSFPGGVQGPRPAPATPESAESGGGAGAPGDAGQFGVVPPKPGPPPTGSQPDPRAAEVTDVVTARLDGLDDLPVAEHVPAFEAVHRALQDTLAAVDGS